MLFKMSNIVTFKRLF